MGRQTGKYVTWAVCLFLLLAAGVGLAIASSQKEGSAPVQLTEASPDMSCQTSSDCVVKDVGNCCGYYPACVNANAKTDPEAVKKKCEQDGMASICGFADIQSCSCVNQRCVPSGGLSAQ